jgi:glycosyltransferase involved in cell wall biosynthesis
VRILTVVVAYRRLGLLKRTLRSYAETITGEHRLIVVDNRSDYRTRRWLAESGLEVEFLHANRYPGAATNRGFELGTADYDAELLHRSDSDFEYLEGWAEHVRDWFDRDPWLGQLGLRTLEEEGAQGAVGGTSVIRRRLFAEGLRYSELPWSECPFEDGKLSHQVNAAGWNWARVTQPCAIHIGKCDPKLAYYRETFGVRGIGFTGWEGA